MILVQTPVQSKGFTCLALSYLKVCILQSFDQNKKNPSCLPKTEIVTFKTLPLELPTRTSARNLLIFCSRESARISIIAGCNSRYSTV